MPSRKNKKNYTENLIMLDEFHRLPLHESNHRITWPLVSAQQAIIELLKKLELLDPVYRSYVDETGNIFSKIAVNKVDSTWPRPPVKRKPHKWIPIPTWGEPLPPSTQEPTDEELTYNHERPCETGETDLFSQALGDGFDHARVFRAVGLRIAQYLSDRDRYGILMASSETYPIVYRGERGARLTELLAANLPILAPSKNKKESKSCHFSPETQEPEYDEARCRVCYERNQQIADPFIKLQNEILVLLEKVEFMDPVYRHFVDETGIIATKIGLKKNYSTSSNPSPNTNNTNNCGFPTCPLRYPIDQRTIDKHPPICSTIDTDLFTYAMGDGLDHARVFRVIGLRIAQYLSDRDRYSPFMETCETYPIVYEGERGVSLKKLTDSIPVGNKAFLELYNRTQTPDLNACSNQVILDDLAQMKAYYEAPPHERRFMLSDFETEWLYDRRCDNYMYTPEELKLKYINSDGIATKPWEGWTAILDNAPPLTKSDHALNIWLEVLFVKMESDFLAKTQEKPNYHPDNCNIPKTWQSLGNPGGCSERKKTTDVLRPNRRIDSLHASVLDAIRAAFNASGATLRSDFATLMCDDATLNANKPAKNAIDSGLNAVNSAKVDFAIGMKSGIRFSIKKALRRLAYN